MNTERATEDAKVFRPETQCTVLQSELACALRTVHALIHIDIVCNILSAQMKRWSGTRLTNSTEAIALEATILSAQVAHSAGVDCRCALRLIL